MHLYLHNEKYSIRGLLVGLGLKPNGGKDDGGEPVEEEDEVFRGDGSATRYCTIISVDDMLEKVRYH